MFPSPYGVSFILISSRKKNAKFDEVDVEFPSPYGVSFILIIGTYDECYEYAEKFPSPYGVSFILI